MRVQIKHDIESENVIRRLKYVLDFINNHPFNNEQLELTIEESPIQITYGNDTIAQTTIFKQALFFLKEPINLKSWEFAKDEFYGKDIYFLTHREIKNNSSTTLLPFDIFENIFFHISRYEEWFPSEPNKDQYDRIISSSLLSVQNKIENQAVVDQLVEVLLLALNITPFNNKAITLSHDIDEIIRFKNIFSLLRGLGGAMARERSLHQLKLLWRSYFEKKDPYDVFDWMLLDRKDIKKQIYLLVGGNHEFDSPIDLGHPIAKNMIKLSEDRGYEIGIHPSFSSYNNIELFRKEKTILESHLNREVSISRQHYLRFSWDYTPEIIECLGIKEDSSLGFHERLGYRCGTGVAYHLYNFNKERPYSFLERPLVCMDASIIRNSGITSDEILSSFLSYKNDRSAALTYNFHNSRFFFSQLLCQDLRSIYEKIFN